VNTSSSTTLVGLYASSEDNTSGHTTRAVFRDFRFLNLSPIPTQYLNEGDQARFRIPAVDYNDPAQKLTWSLVGSIPPGATIDAATGEFSWTSSETGGPSTNILTIRVADDGSPSLSTTNRFTIVLRGVNSAPILTVPVDQVVNELTALTLTNIATDADVPANKLTFALVAAPTGMAINTTNGVLTWTSSEIQGPSTNLVIVRVYDNGSPSLAATNSFTVVVNEVNSAPSLLGQSDRTVNELATLTVTNFASDLDLPINALTFELLDAPAGLSLDPNTGVIAWIPTESQGPSTNLVSVRVLDNGSPSLSATNSFLVTVQEVNTAPVLAAVNEQAMDEQQPLSFTLSATDSDLPSQSLSFALVSGPPRLTVSSAGHCAWTPTEDQGPSTNTVLVKVTDDGTPPLSATNSFTIVVNEVNSAPVLPAQFDRTVNALESLKVTNTAADPDLPLNVLTYQLLNAPTGVAIDTNGIITWTPAAARAPSTNTLTTVVTDNGVPPLGTTNAFTVVVKSQASTPPVLAVPELLDDSLTLSWSTIPGKVYRVQFNSDPSTTNWANLGPDITATGTSMSKIDFRTTTNRFYRVQLLP
jgi:hypothetical protein